MSTAARQMSPAKPRKIEVTARYLRQNAAMAVQDVYDALIELITNADDRYVWLEQHGRSVTGRIEVEVERRRKEAPSVVRVRDFADGMTLDVMQAKLCQLGKRVSGMAEGYDVRGSNSRGAKDVAVLGGVTFESIAGDGRYHKCAITRNLEFVPYEPSRRTTAKERELLQIPNGTGTLVTMTVDPTHRIPQHDTLKHNLGSLVALRDILGGKERAIILRDLSQEREDQVMCVRIEGREVLKERFRVPGYPDAEAKLVIKRASKRIDDRRPKFRPGGILVKSRRGVHEATYFASDLEIDPHAAWFFGKLTCHYIDDVWNEYDDQIEQRSRGTEQNPSWIVDPSRKAGLRRDHPFTKALFGEALKRLRPLVEAERKRAERERAQIESAQTRKRLNALERAAARFMQQHLTESDTARDPGGRETDSTFLRDGFTLSPPFAQIVQGHSCRFWLNVRQESFPELSLGDPVEISCLTDEISSSRRYAPLERHPAQEGVLRSVWLVKGERPTKATGIKVRIGAIVASRVIEVLESERDKYEHVTELCIQHRRYSIVVGKPKSVQILAPYPSVVGGDAPIDVTCSDRRFRVTGERVLKPRPDWGVAMCKLRVEANEPDRKATLYAGLKGHVVSAELLSALPTGAPINIKIVPEDFGNQRYAWHANTLRIAARHPSIRRYLGVTPPFSNQEEKHFRVLLAEIVAEAVCQRVLSKKVEESPKEYEEADWDAYYADYTKLMTEFLPMAHESQVKDP